MRFRCCVAWIVLVVAGAAGAVTPALAQGVITTPTPGRGPQLPGGGTVPGTPQPTIPRTVPGLGNVGERLPELPRITRLDTGTTNYFFVRTAFIARLAGLGDAGEVRLELAPHTGAIPAGATRTDCWFSGAGGQTAPAVVAADHTAFATFAGVWRPRRQSLVVDRPGHCWIAVKVQRRAPDLSYRTENELVFGPVDIAAHEAVRVRSTAAMRGFLKVNASGACASADDGGQFGERLTAAPGGNSCRADFLDPSSAQSIGTHEGNPLPEAVILSSMKWRVDGDTGGCELCSNPVAPCRGIGQVAFVGSAFFPFNWVYAPVATGNPQPGVTYSVFAGPPDVASQAPIGIRDLGDGYDPAMADFVRNIFGNGIDDSAAIIGYNRRGMWQDYLRPFGIRMACSPWSPVAAANVAGSAIGSLAHGQAPTASAAPTLRLVLEEVWVLRPPGRALPWE